MPIDLTDTITRLLTLDVVRSSSWNFQSLIHVIYRRAVLNTHHLQPKFVVSRRLQFSKGFWVFLFCPWNHLSGGGVHANHNAMHLPCFTRKNKTANDSKLLNNSKGNRDGEWNFCRWEGARHCFIHISGVDIHEKDKKKSSNQMSQLLPETGRSQKQTKWIKIHQSQTITLLNSFK